MTKSLLRPDAKVKIRERLDLEDDGKRPASRKVLSKMLSNVKQYGANLLDLPVGNSYNNNIAGVAELADAPDLKSGGLSPCGFESHSRHQLESEYALVDSNTGLFSRLHPHRLYCRALA